jgi:hypothetical protein
MAIHIALNHKTHYLYDRRVNLGPQIVRLRPAPHSRNPILSYSLNIEPKNHFINWQQDPQGNYLARLVFSEPTTQFLVEVDLVVEMAVFNPFDFFLEPAAEQYPFSYDADLARELRPFLEIEPAGTALCSFLSKVPRETVRTIDFLVDLNQRLKNDIGYVIRMEPGVQSCEQTLNLATWVSRPASSLAISFSLPPTLNRWKVPPVRPPILPTCTRGRNYICLGRDGSAWTPPPECWRERATYRWHARPTQAAQLLFPVNSIPATPNFVMR